VADPVVVTFAPAGVTVEVSPGTSLADAAMLAGILLATPCGGRGVCAGCAVRVISGSLEPPDEVERQALKRAGKGIRLACRARAVIGPVEVQPLWTSRAASSAARTGATAGAGPVEDLVAGIDLGTTTVAALLVDAESGREIVRAATPNLQASIGADVLSRISAAMSGRGSELQKQAEGSIAAALKSAALAGGIDLPRIRRLVVAGNSAMAALLVGADVSTLATHPFSAPGGIDRLTHALSLGEMMSGASDVRVVPPVAAFVGGDALAATVAAGLVDADAPTLLVDIGTNAEIVLAMPGGRILVASTAAGPAFEGVGIRSGGPAADGAVERVELSDHDLVLHCIGGGAAKWFSGAGLISALAVLRTSGHLAADGMLRADGILRERFGKDSDGVVEVRLSSGAGTRLVITQLDVRAVQLAKAAVRSGVESVLRRAGISATDLAELLVAGAFGAALDPDDLVALGVLPSNARGRIRRVGNAALKGAAAFALDWGTYELAAQVAKRAINVDLATDEHFNSVFVTATELTAYET
jgi:uncharacterized 2Fe-2S/4Fe-4S cluster protein (DUF4445 family)